MRKTDFFILGAPRYGTTFFHNYLEQHTEIAILAKDVYFFESDFIFHSLPRMEKVRIKENILSFYR